MERAKTDEISVAEVTDFSAVVGNGLTATLAGKMIKQEIFLLSANL